MQVNQQETIMKMSRANFELQLKTRLESDRVIALRDRGAISWEYAKEHGITRRQACRILQHPKGDRAELLEHAKEQAPTDDRIRMMTASRHRTNKSGKRARKKRYREKRKINRSP